MRVVILGAGAMGSFFGALLARDHDVTLVARPDHARAVREGGLTVSGRTTFAARPKAVEAVADVEGHADLVLVAVKAYDTRAAADVLKPIVGRDTLIATLQNGLGNVETLLDRFAAKRVVAGATSHGVTFVEPGHVRHAGLGYTVVGSPVGETAAAKTVADLLGAAGHETALSERILGEVWAKVVVNAAINPVTAITGLPNGALLEQPHLKEIMTLAAEEAVEVAKAERAPLPDDDLVIRARVVAERTAENKSSMLQDVERGRRTEIDAISGEIAARGRRLGVDTPVTRTLVALVKGIESTTRR
ncbi:MAG TPA: 2-dehydropantoate 2-reductase [Candidatus Thermoplasmatota archaeon]|nr:2-dehydropantoate 2-reductase [Candidatus Thermoplasmatota archaeon]